MNARLGAIVLVAASAACAVGTVDDRIVDSPDAAEGAAPDATRDDDAAPDEDAAPMIDWDATSGGFDAGHRYDSSSHYDAGHARDASVTDVSVADVDIDAATCGPLVAPSVSATCRSCSGQSCQPNGCYGGYWCNTTTNRCEAPPTGCP